MSGTTTNSQYRKLAKDVVKQYVKVVNYIRAARRIEDRAPAARGLGNTTRGNEKETVEVIIPVHDRNLLKEIARKFGWALL